MQQPWEDDEVVQEEPWTQDAPVDADAPAAPTATQPPQQQAPQQPPTTSTGGNIVRPTPGGTVLRAITGHGRIPEGSEDMGSFQATDASTGQQIRLAAGYLMSTDPQQRMEMMREVLGDGVEFEEDEAGNTIVRYGGETAFLNRPGFGPNDAVDLASEIIAFLPAAKAAQWLGQVARWGARIVGGGVAGGATEYARQQGAVASGAEEVNPTTVALSTVFSAGGEGLGGLIQRFTPEARNAIRRVRDVYGIDLRGTPHAQVGQTADYARTHVPSRPGITEGRPVYERATPYDDLQVELQSQRRTERDAAAALYAEARANNTAAFRPAQVTRMKDDILEDFDLRGLDTRDIGGASRYLNDLDELTSEGGIVDIAQMERWRRRTASAQRDAQAAFDRSGARGQEALALGRMVKHYDDWLQNQYIDDMIVGDPAAVEMWRNARSEWRQVMDRFDDDEIVRKLIFERNATPEQMREWLFGVASTQSPARAGETVRRLNTIFGRESEIMERVQADFMLDIIDPLLRDTPNLPQFVQNFDNLIQDRPTLVRELFTPDEIRAWEELSAYVRGIRHRPGTDITMLPQDFMGKVSAFVVRMTIGHGIAKGGARVQLGTGILDRLRVGTAGRLGRRQILEEVLGVYPLRPLVPHGTGTVMGGVLGSRFGQPEQQREP